MSLRVIDFFCGAGGFSEGFRQAGFDIIWAVDLWQPAVDTHSENHPQTQVIKDNVIRLSLLPDSEFDSIIPDAEIIIGSPPCTAFSNSNKSGKGDKAKGIALIEAYLRIIARKKFKKNSILKYWILENVPKVQLHIQQKYSAADLKVEGRFELFVKVGNANVYDAKYFGVPSSRKRFFCGEFPLPHQVFSKEEDLISLNTITKSLAAPKEKLNQEIADPIYNLRLKGVDITDHHYIQELAEFEWKAAKRLKQDKGYMGKMSLPENGNKPARTIMATMSFSARESFILSIDANRFRAPTIREVASLMSFPIDYRFYGTSIRTKYKLVGNAVPPKMAYAFADAINKVEAYRPSELYIPIKHTEKIDFTNLNFDIFHINIEQQKKITAKFKYHLPYFIHNAFRVELTNHHSDFNKLIFRWNCEIHYSQGKKAKIYTPQINQCGLDKGDTLKAKDILLRIKQLKTTGNKFQEIFCKTYEDRKTNNLVGPFELLYLINKFISENFIFNKEDKKLNILNSELKKLPRPVGIAYYILSKSIQLINIL